MNFRDSLPIVLAAGAVGLAIAQAIHPFGNRIPPGILVTVALLSVLRYVLRRQLQKGNKLINDVPQRPLGITDDAENN